MTPREFDNYRKGYIRRIEAIDQTEWVRTRWLGFIMIKTVDAKGKYKTPKDLFKFDWEQSNIDQEKIKKLERRFPKTLAEVKSKKWEKVGKRG